MDKLQDHAIPLVEKEADFETASTATGFGKYNILLALLALPPAISINSEVFSMSYVFPVAECDLSLSLSDKGLLNAVVYIGMVLSAFVWGYLCDTIGRKKVLVVTLLLNGMFVILSSLTQSFPMLIFAKFMGGVAISGSISALTTYMSEFHCSKYRTLVQITIGFWYSVGVVLPPLLAWAIMSLEINFKLLNGILELHSWNLFLLTLALAPIISGLMFLFLPETPKFLMTAGKNEEALKVFQMMYQMNTGKSADMYPIKALVKEKEKKIESDLGKPKKNWLVRSVQQFEQLFHPPHVFRITLFATIQLMFMMGVFSLQLWLPQIFQAISDYQFLNNGSTSDLCTMLDVIRPKELNATSDVETCVVNKDNSAVYINTLILTPVSMVGYVSTGVLIKKIGNKKLLVLFGAGGSISALLIYLAKNSVTTLILSSLHGAFGNICTIIIISVVVDLFPTTFRAMAISITLTTGRLGVSVGNLIFPFLLQTGCSPPFIFVGAIMMGGALLCLIIPNTDSKALE